MTTHAIQTSEFQPCHDHVAYRRHNPYDKGFSAAFYNQVAEALTAWPVQESTVQPSQPQPADHTLVSAMESHRQVASSMTTQFCD